MAFVSSAWLIKSPFSSNQCARGRATRREVTIAVNRRTVSMSGPVEEKGGGMRLIRAADEETISKLGCRSWGTWGCEPSTFPWTYADDEVCLVLEGDFTVTSDNGGDAMGKLATCLFFASPDASGLITRRSLSDRKLMRIRLFLENC